MTPGGAEALKAAIRRSLPLIVGLVVLGIVAVNLFEHLAGAKYQANANVQINSTSLTQILTGTTQPFSDPTSDQATAQTIASGLAVYRIAAARTRYQYGLAGTLQGDTSVIAPTNSTELLGFQATASSPNAAVAIANAAASGYVTYNASLTRAQIASTIAQLQSSAGGGTPTGTLKQSIQKLQLDESTSSTTAQVVQPALTATKTSPKTVKDSLIGFGVGLVIALLLVAIREAVDTTIRSEGEVEEMLGAPVLASVRSLPRRTQIVTLGRFEPMYGDSYALLAAQLAPDRRDGEHSVLAFTSAVAGEGKTTTVANLAVSLAKRGHHVALADFDFHRPTLARLFEIPDGVSGALQVLDGSENLDDALWQVSLDGGRAVASARADTAKLDERRVRAAARGGVRGGAFTNGSGEAPGSLIVLPSGKSSTATAQQRTASMGPLLRELSSHAEIVILDTPPALLTVEMTELAQLIDMVVVVVRQGHVSQRLLRSLGRQARTWPAELTGAVLTDVPSSGGYASYYGGK
jgi:Mrp family chromosome partitioning ATPase